VTQHEHSVKQYQFVPTPLAPDRVRVWYRVTASIDEVSLAAALSVLSDAERARCRQFLFAPDRRDYAAAHALVRAVLSRYADIHPAGWRFQQGANGKPRLAGGSEVPPLSFNLSHTHGCVACAVAPGVDVGIDVEQTDRRVAAAEVAARFFSSQENADLAQLAPGERTERFFELWTLKEAYLKAIGTGLSHPLSTVTFALDRPATIGFVPPPDEDGAAWQFALFAPTPRHRIALAVRQARNSEWRIEAASHDASVPLPPVRTGSAKL
jgi:4'-phosphopantetheinyl transferase